MSWRDEYQSKCMDADAVLDSFVESGMKLYTSGLHVPSVLINGLVRRVKDGRLSGIETWGNWMNGKFPFKDLELERSRFRYHTYFAGPNERGGFGKTVAHIPVHFGDVAGLARYVSPDVALITVTPPDEKGMVNMGPLGFTVDFVPCCKTIVAQVNRNLPFVTGDCHTLHVSQIARLSSMTRNSRTFR